MKDLREYMDQALQWKRLKWWRRDFELYAGSEIVARLLKERGTGRIIGETSYDRWAFKRRSFWKPDIVIIDLVSQTEIAVIVRHWRKPRITFPDGHALFWKKANFWGTEWDWVNEFESPLIHFRRGKRVEIEPDAWYLPELLLLVVAGFHFLIVKEEEAAAASV